MSGSNRELGPFGKSFIGDFPTSGTLWLLVVSFLLSAVFSLGNFFPFLILFLLSSSLMIVISYNFVEPHFNSKPTMSEIGRVVKVSSYFESLKRSLTSGPGRPDEIISFRDAIKSFFKNPVDFRGRSSRSEHNWVLLFNLLIFIPLIILQFLLFLPLSANLPDFLLLLVLLINLLFGLIVVLFDLALLIMYLILSVRRIHDIGYSGWYIFVYYLISTIFFYYNNFNPYTEIILSLPLLLWLMFSPGGDVSNKYGQVPSNKLNVDGTTFLADEVWDLSGSNLSKIFRNSTNFPSNNSDEFRPGMEKKVLLQTSGLWGSLFILNYLTLFITIGIIVVFDMNSIDLFSQLMGLLYYLLSLIILLIFLNYEDDKNKFWALFSIPRNTYSWVLAIIVFIFDIILIFIVYDFVYEILMPAIPSGEMFLDSESSSDPLILLLLFVLLSIAAPLFEEMIYRGYILSKLRVSFSDNISILLSGLLFGLAHWDPFFAPFDLYQTGAATIGGFLYGWLRIRTGSLWPGIICHSLWNGGIFLLLLIYGF